MRSILSLTLTVRPPLPRKWHAPMSADAGETTTTAPRACSQFHRQSGNYIRFTYQVESENCGFSACDG